MSEKKFCKDCKYFRQSYAVNHPRCANLEVKKAQVSLVYGQIYNYVFCEDARGLFGRCGWKAKYYEPV